MVPPPPSEPGLQPAPVSRSLRDVIQAEEELRHGRSPSGAGPAGMVVASPVCGGDPPYDEVPGSIMRGSETN